MADKPFTARDLFDDLVIGDQTGELIHSYDLSGEDEILVKQYNDDGDVSATFVVTITVRDL